MGGSASAQGPQRPRVVSVELAKAERKSVPVDVDAIGTVTPISSVALKSRLETTIVSVHFEDGAKVNEGDLLFTLDARQIDAQIEQAEGMLAKDQAQLEGAQRDLRRYSDLVGKGATTQVNVDNAKTQSDILIGTIKADQSALDNLKVQKSYTTDPRAVLGPDQRRQCEGRQFRAPGRYRAARRHQPDGAGLCDLRRSAARAGRSARSHGEGRLRGDRDDPGPSAFRERQGRDGRKHRRCHHRHGHRARHHEQRERDAVAGNAGRRPSSSSAARTPSSVPTVAVQRSQNGNFVFVVKDGVATVQPVKVDRTFAGHVGDLGRARPAARASWSTGNCCCRTERGSSRARQKAGA